MFALTYRKTLKEKKISGEKNMLTQETTKCSRLGKMISNRKTVYRR